MDSSQFKIYDASAGSGKTFTLVKEYLSILLSNENPIQIKKILAITFTNKAVNEMKMRILKHLQEFSEENILQSNDQMASDICTSLGINIKTLNKRAEKALKFILHNYYYFDVVTIDKFNHRLLKTFAHDLKLPVNFEAAIDTKLLLEEAVDNLIQKAGNDKLLTKVLIDFALSKTDDDKSWNIALDLYKIASLLLEENHSGQLSQIKNKSINDFIELNYLLKTLLSELDKKIKQDALEILNLFSANNLEPTDFFKSTLSNHFKKIAAGNYERLFQNKLEENIDEGKSLYTKSLLEEKKLLINSLLPQISETYKNTKNKIYQLKFLQNFQKNLIPLSLLNSINKELQLIKDAQNILLVSEFNKIISQAISNQPAPFIYERIGEKYQSYFIDEFQDTSEMQWNNLIPLIDNALITESTQGKRGSLSIVGDAKQAIYRWRGGKAEQFIGLCSEVNPFDVSKEKISLPKNYRSYDELVNFNNAFFKHISQYLSNHNYRDLYENHSFQETNNKKGGYVNFTFVNNNDEAYCEVVLNQILSLKESGYSFKDICVLTQKKKHGLLIANFLAENNISIISSESLLLKNNAAINFLTNLIKLSSYSSNNEIRLHLIEFLAIKQQVLDKHSFISQYLNKIDTLFIEYLFKYNEFISLPLYNAVEYAIISFKLNKESDAYLQYFLDEILAFSTKKQGTDAFLDYWEKKKDSLSIVAPQNSNAVQIMTIHKAKGLEFPIIIYPFANTNIYAEIEPKTWLPVDESIYGIPASLIDKKTEMQHYNNYAAKQFKDWQAKLELDQFNVLYVALTRAIEKMYIISKKEINEKCTTFSGLFINFLKKKELYNDTDHIYELGITKKKGVDSVSDKNESKSLPYIANHTFNKNFKIVTKSGVLWGSSQEIAIQKGNLYHLVLSKIKYASDINNVVEDHYTKGIINAHEKELIHSKLEEIVEHPELKKLFTTQNKIYNEQIIYTNNSILQPDRIVISPTNELTLIDYKTGSFYSEYTFQLQKYSQALTEIGYTVNNKLLVFINDKIEVMHMS